MSIIEQIANAGVVGAGGAGFPTHVKLKTKADYFIINAAECEPLIETDKYITRTFAKEIVSTVDIIADQLGATHRVIGIKSKYAKEIQCLKTAINKLSSNVQIFEMKSFYPAGDEQLMVKLITGKTVPERGLPLDVCAVVNNVGTILSIYDALNGKAVTDKYLSITGDVKEAVIIKAPIGTKIIECLEAAQLNVKDYGIILGGPMMGSSYTDDEKIASLTVTKTTGNILVLPKDHYLFTRAKISLSRIKAQTNSGCIQCRMCTDLCPRYLTGHSIRPNLIMRSVFSEHLIEDNDEYLKTFGSAAFCCDCGVCEMFACPMGLSPRKVNIFIKFQLRKRSIEVPRNLNPVEREGFKYKTIPTDRLIARLNLTDYYNKHAQKCIELTPKSIYVELSQHIGAPAECIKNVGDEVKIGDLVAKAVEGKLSANIHSGIKGIITEINKTNLVIVNQ